jgi:hypothetical protein
MRKNRKRDRVALACSTPHCQPDCVYIITDSTLFVNIFPQIIKTLLEERYRVPIPDQIRETKAQRSTVPNRATNLVV